MQAKPLDNSNMEAKPLDNSNMEAKPLDNNMEAKPLDNSNMEVKLLDSQPEAEDRTVDRLSSGSGVRSTQERAVKQEVEPASRNENVPEVEEFRVKMEDPEEVSMEVQEDSVDGQCQWLYRFDSKVKCETGERLQTIHAETVETTSSDSLLLPGHRGEGMTGVWSGERTFPLAVQTGQDVEVKGEVSEHEAMMFEYHRVAWQKETQTIQGTERRQAEGDDEEKRKQSRVIQGTSILPGERNSVLFPGSKLDDKTEDSLSSSEEEQSQVGICQESVCNRDSGEAESRGRAREGPANSVTGSAANGNTVLFPCSFVNSSAESASWHPGLMMPPSAANVLQTVVSLPDTKAARPRAVVSRSQASGNMPQAVVSTTSQTVVNKLQGAAGTAQTVAVAPQAVENTLQSAAVIPQTIAVGPQIVVNTFHTVAEVRAKTSRTTAGRPRASANTSQIVAGRLQTVVNMLQNVATVPQTVASTLQNVAAVPKVVANTSLTVAGRPQTVVNMLQNVATTRQTVVNMLQNVATIPQTVANTSQTVAGRPQTVVNMLQNVATTRQTVASTLQNVVTFPQVAENTLQSKADGPPQTATGMSKTVAVMMLAKAAAPPTVRNTFKTATLTPQVKTAVQRLEPKMPRQTASNDPDKESKTVAVMMLAKAAAPPTVRNTLKTATSTPQVKTAVQRLESKMPRQTASSDPDKETSRSRSEGAVAGAGTRETCGRQENRPAECEAGSSASELPGKQSWTHRRAVAFRKPTRKTYRIVHRGDKALRCDQCSQAFTRTDSLRDHAVRAHSGKKPFECKHCSKRYALWKDCKRHMRWFSHNDKVRGRRAKSHKEQSLVCTRRRKLCPQTKVNAISHSDAKRYKCRGCGQTFTTRAGLYLHQKQICTDSKTKRTTPSAETADGAGKSACADKEAAHSQLDHEGGMEAAGSWNSLDAGELRADTAAAVSVREEQSARAQDASGTAGRQKQSQDSVVSTGPQQREEILQDIQAPVAEGGRGSTSCEADEDSGRDDSSDGKAKGVVDSSLVQSTSEGAKISENGHALESQSRTEKSTRPASRFVCRVCVESFACPTEAEQHMWKSNHEADVRCTLCSELYTGGDAEGLSEHSRKCLAAGPDSSRSDDSDHTAPSHQASSSTKSEKSEDAFKCDLCEAVLVSKGKLARHRRSHEEGSYSCDFCHVPDFKNRRSILNHIKKSCRVVKYIKELSHKMPKIPSCLLYACRWCKATFEGVAKWRRHEKTKCPKKMFECDECAEQFEKKCRLNQHLKTHRVKKAQADNHVGDKVSFTRHVHSKTTRSKSSLKQHVPEHRENLLNNCEKVALLPSLPKSAASTMTSSPEAPGPAENNPSEVSVPSLPKATTSNVAVPSPPENNPSENSAPSLPKSRASTVSLTPREPSPAENNPSEDSVSSLPKSTASKMTLTPVVPSPTDNYPSEVSVPSLPKSGASNAVEPSPAENEPCEVLVTPMQCDQCPARFCTRTAMRKHLERHLDRSKCENCSAIFSTRLALKRHLERGACEGRVSCDLCSKSFDNFSSLEHHLGQHLPRMLSKTTPFVFTVPRVQLNNAPTSETVPSTAPVTRRVPLTNAPLPSTLSETAPNSAPSVQQVQHNVNKVPLSSVFPLTAPNAVSLIPQLRQHPAQSRLLAAPVQPQPASTTTSSFLIVQWNGTQVPPPPSQVSSGCSVLVLGAAAPGLKSGLS